MFADTSIDAHARFSFKIQHTVVLNILGKYQDPCSSHRASREYISLSLLFFIAFAVLRDKHANQEIARYQCFSVDNVRCARGVKSRAQIF